ncbi:hypothetical protein EW145_g6006 [Phellinidium pouzarii]|uniref:Crinkler effector protein N-terminal domain-containing protein n=1 Tax=Phellinidium pouzarii TaxID=167371 RepID=A0A4S4L2T9_9AGAM|nr:hypothetical protein EW145_g6006 [Phellinidium pouzarii]
MFYKHKILRVIAPYPAVARKDLLSATALPWTWNVVSTDIVKATGILEAVKESMLPNAIVGKGKASLYSCVGSLAIRAKTFFSVKISNIEFVSSLKEAILEKTKNRFKNVDAFTLSLWKVSIAYDTPDRKAKLGEIKDPEEVEGSEKLSSEDGLAEIFTDPPKTKHIHIIVCPPDYQLPRSLITPPPTSQSAENNTFTPRKTKAQTEALVNELLRSYRTKLDNYVAGPAWSQFWTAPPTVEPETANFINALQIPLVENESMLLLHGLGDGIVDERTVSNLFNGKDRFLANTSGSGKTRLLIEGLNKNWGFYFTSVQNSVTPLGSRDIMSAIDDDIPNSKRFVCNLDSLGDSQKTDALFVNKSIAKRRIHQILTARIFVFEFFLKAVERVHPSKPIADFRKHWLFLQLLPGRVFSNNIFREDVLRKDVPEETVLREDIFYQFSSILKDTSDDSLNLSDRLVQAKIKQLQKRFDLGEDFYFVLDEAQYAGEELEDAFRSRDGLLKRPILRQIITAWSDAAEFPIIVSGTGLSIDVVNEVIASAVAKAERFKFSSNTGAFDTPEQQKNYFLRYMPKHIADSDSARVLFARAWNWHRFTAFFVVLLIVSAFQSPHRLLDKYVLQVTNFEPTDGERFTCLERVVEELPIMPTLLNFEKIRNDARRLQLFSRIVYLWLMHRRLLFLRKEERKLVELGFARFVDGNEHEAYVNEPLVLLAATNEFDEASASSFGDYIKERLRDDTEKGLQYQDLLAFYLASAFGAYVRLRDVFDFRGTVPQWAEQTAELVSISWNDEDGVQSHPFSLQDRIGVPSSIGHKCSSWLETAKWFKTTPTLMCFPDNLMGPDLVLFIRLASGLILCVVIQAKWLDQKYLSGVGLAEAAATLDPLFFYDRKGLKESSGSEARTNVFECIRRLGEVGPEHKEEAFFSTDLPVLRVLASYPAAVRRESLPAGYVILNMRRCRDVADGKGILEAVKWSLLVRKRKALSDVPDTSALQDTGAVPVDSLKRRRTGE